MSLISFLRKVSRERPSLEIRSEGISYPVAKGTRLLRWTDVSRISAWMTDHFTIDCVWVCVVDGKSGFKIPDADGQFTELVAQINARFDVRPDWLAEVSFPPF